MGKISKYDVLNLLAKKMPFYGATQWLKTEREELGGDSPSDILKENKISLVYELLEKDLKKGK
jgi:hypothetical protein